MFRQSPGKDAPNVLLLTTFLPTTEHPLNKQLKGCHTAICQVDKSSIDCEILCDLRASDAHVFQ